MAGYADVEALLVGWLAARFPTVRACTELPAALPPQTIQVVRFGGGPGAIPFDLAHVDIDCYAADRAGAHALAASVQAALMYALPGYSTNGSRVLSAECTSGPSWAPYDNTNVRRNTAAYQVRTANPI